MRQEKNAALLEREIQNSGFRDWFGIPIEKYTTLYRFEPKEFLFQMGEDCPFLYFITRGQAKLYHPQANGKMALIDFFSAPCFVGEMELMEPQPMAGSVQAITRCWCVALPISQCRPLLMEDTLFLRRLCVFLSRKSILQGRSLAKNQAYPLKNRFASFILHTSPGGLYTERHTEASEYMGVSYRYLLLVLAGLVKDGVLEHTEEGYLIRNKETLRRLAKELEE